MTDIEQPGLRKASDNGKGPMFSDRPFAPSRPNSLRTRLWAKWNPAVAKIAGMLASIVLS